ncbi:unnamed protein product [Allacma fusca]|uniref:BED-type domain-containing protein n=1 Tax=Allacma fusca TaxID=39272 RepID=A0A8J2LJA3_9HEXA|nr:unnamed protein product [Allacma fusca]
METVGNNDDEPMSDASINSDDIDFNANVESDEKMGAQVESHKNKQIGKRPNVKIPTWMQKYYEYEGHVEGTKTQRQTIVLTCKICKISNLSTKQGRITGTPYFNFYRHLKTAHQPDYDTEVQCGNIGDTTKPKVWSNVGTAGSISPFVPTRWIRPNNTNAYSMNHPVQIRFIKDLIDCVCIDMLPLDFIERPTFIKLVRNLNGRIRLFSRRTLGRRLNKCFEEFQQKIKKTMKRLEPETLHLILDM